MIKVSDLRGPKSLRALNAFNVLLLGLKMLPAYASETYEEFLESFLVKTDAEKEKALREAAMFVELAEDEVNALLSFALDPNGVPYSRINSSKLSAKEIFEIVVAVCMEIGRLEVTLVSESEKKKLHHSQLT